MTVKKELFEMENGSIVSVYNQDFTVEQVVKLNAGSLNYLLKDGAAVKWLCARIFDEAAAVLCDQVTLDGDSFGKELHHDGVDYTLLKTGSTRAVTTSSMGYPCYVNMEFYDYSAGDGARYLFVMKGEGLVTAAAGETVIGSAIMVFPKPHQ